jgi:hypothetical protein
MTYEQYSKIIIGFLIKLRAKESFKLHESSFYSPFLGDRKDSLANKLHPCYQLLPPRRSWAKVSENFRRSHNLTQVIEERLKLTVMSDYRSAEALGHFQSLEYIEKLEDFIRDGWERFLDYYLEAPKIAFIPKDKTYSRPITLYKDIDRFNIGIWARRLTDLMEPHLSDSAVAFRGIDFRRVCSLNNHHQVFALIVRFWQHHYQGKGKEIWVAEADVKGFFDNVSKSNVINYFPDHLYEKPPPYIGSYLSTYSFYDYLLREAKRSDVRVKNYREDMELLDPNFDPTNYGVPQGGALSCVIANMVFDPIDKAIESLASGRHLLYLRYCDDMILMSPDKGLLSAAFDTYCGMCQQLKIPVHKASVVSSYDKSFWSLKSKAPYRLGAQSGDVPWFSFLGYQMSHEGKLRMRSASIHKELTAQKEIVDQVLYSLHTGNLNEKQQQDLPVIAKVEARFYKRISGLVQSNKLKGGGFSWSNGFSLMTDSRYDIETNQLKLLDRKKQKQLRRLVRRGHKMPSFTSSYYAYVKGARYRSVRSTTNNNETISIDSGAI